ncbi:MAG: ATP-binding cassette domain-containing protein [Clostridia bacterium]|nr:ATP-binding cassette domain-containing protein [Clostridia bacterium]
MISVENLTKIYKSKKGVDVEALKGISLNLPSRGLVFVLGKSGCGKSTLLNVLGGLDSFDGGEIRVGGKNLKDYTPAELNNYRNLFTGFVFQEYNLFDGYTVEENVALALNLQGNRETDRVAEILKKVELEELKDRKPPNLSGGQRQRVAIARALVKDAKLILCDEPTGALDSETGESIFNLLKEVSKERLVVVVSHDRDFAETFGDRIIEMKDGRIESDSAAEAGEEQVEISDAKGGKLSAKNTFKMGLGYLKHRKIRLVFAMIIAVLTLSMFGFANVMAAFSPTTVLANAYKDGLLPAVTYVKQYNADDPTENASYEGFLSNEDLQRISEELNCEVTPVYRFYQGKYDNFVKTPSNSYGDLERNAGFAEINQKFLDDFKYKLDGRLPENEDEIVITEYVYSLYEVGGYKWEETEYEIKSHSDLIGKRLLLRDAELGVITPKVVGILDTKLNIGEVQEILNSNVFGEIYDKYHNLTMTLKYSFHNVFFTCEGFYDGSDKDYIFGYGYSRDIYKINSPIATDNGIRGAVNNSYYSENVNPDIYFKEGVSLSNLSGNQIVVPGSCLVGCPDAEVISSTASGDISAFAHEHFPLIEEEFKKVYGQNSYWTDYRNYIFNYRVGNKFEPGYDYFYFRNAAERRLTAQYFEEHATELTAAKLSFEYGVLRQGSQELSYSYITGNKYEDVEIVGYWGYNYAIVSDEMLDKLQEDAGFYDCAFAAVHVPSTLTAIKNRIQFTEATFDCESVLEDTHGTVSYVIINQITWIIDNEISGIFELLATIFLWATLGMCAVIIIFMAYYFSGVIADKKQEIGILRALGASNRDIVNIFFAENGIIGAIIIALSVIISLVLSLVTNGIFVKQFTLPFSIIIYPVWNVLVLIAATAFALSLGLLLPLLKTVRKKPVEILRDKD